MYSRYALALAGRAIPLAAALMATLYANQPHYKVVSYVGAILVLAVTEYYAVFRPYKSLRDVREKLLDGFFSQRAAVSLNANLGRCSTPNQYRPAEC